jgi:predicted dehydrogenase
MVPNVAEGSDAEVHYAALIRCENGTVISMERGEYMPAHEQMQWQIVGTNGSLNMIMVPWRRGRTMTHDDTTTEEGVVTRTLWESEEGEQAKKQVVVDFAEAIVEGREPLTSLDKALVIQKISDAIYESAATGKAVDID